jgi:hypothetical protein
VCAAAAALTLTLRARPWHAAGPPAAGTAAAKQRLFFARGDGAAADAAPLPLHAALAAAAAAPDAHQWVPDADAVAAATQLLDALKVEDGERERRDEEARHKSSVVAQTSFSDACHLMQANAADAAAEAAVREVAAAVAAGDVPVFTVQATGILSVTLPAAEGADEPQRRFFRPWFFSRPQLERACSALLRSARRARRTLRRVLSSFPSFPFFPQGCWPTALGRTTCQ